LFLYPYGHNIATVNLKFCRNTCFTFYRNFIGSDGNIPFVLELVEHMSKLVEPVATSMPPPFSVVRPHKSFTMTRVLQFIQQAMAAQSNSEDALVSMSQKKNNNNHIVSDVSDIVAYPDEPINPNLQREIDIVQHLLI